MACDSSVVCCMAFSSSVARNQETINDAYFEIIFICSFVHAVVCYRENILLLNFGKIIYNINLKIQGIAVHTRHYLYSDKANYGLPLLIYTKIKQVQMSEPANIGLRNETKQLFNITCQYHTST